MVMDRPVHGRPFCGQETTMRAFVLSGGGNLGPLQIGAMRALFEHNLYPDMMVGCSAGAINAGQVAHDPSQVSVDALAAFWGKTRLRDVYPGPRVKAFFRFIAGKDSLFCNRRFYEMFQRYGLNPAHTFGNWPAIPLYVTATDLRTGQIHVFGDDPNDRILDALMASTALTPFHPPWEVNGERYVDGGTLTPLPIRTALERGAKEIYALHIRDANKDVAEPRSVRGVVGVITRSVDTMLRSQAQHDLLLARSATGVRVHHITLGVPRPISITDFTRSYELVEYGYKETSEYLARNTVTPEPEAAEPTGVMRRAAMAVANWFSPRDALATGNGR
jgi:NTE family protein